LPPFPAIGDNRLKRPEANPPRAGPLLQATGATPLPLVSDWIVHAADPLGSRLPPPRRPLPVGEGGTLVDQAEAHGTLGALLQNFAPLGADPRFAAARDDARLRHRKNAAFARLLAREAEAIMAEAGDLPAAVVKGPVFARTLYPAGTLRCFTDIDLLVAPDALPGAAALLADHGFACVEAGPVERPREWKWVSRTNPNLMVEVHTDLIHAAHLSHAVSLPYAAIAEAPDGAAACLIVAVVHGGAHHYRRLQQVVDVCQAARALTTAADEARFARMVEATGARFLAAAGLSLAARVLGEPRCGAIARGLGPVRHAGLARLLLDRRVVMTATTGRRLRHGWRRAVFHALIKRGEARFG
jgi:hypothetical protein